MLRSDLSARPAAQPYVSVAFVCRNDGYGGDLEARIEKFIEYYARYARRYPGLFEFVICDWNPPPDRPRLREAFPWAELGNVLHVEVPLSVHDRLGGPGARPMLDYIGRNVAMRRGGGEFVLVLNQDIFVSESILEIVARRQLDGRAFYRADRCDFDLDACREAGAEVFEAAALSATFAVHRRHRSDERAISAPATPPIAQDEQSGLEFGDLYAPATALIYCDGAVNLAREDNHKNRCWRWWPFSRSALADWHTHYLAPEYYRRFHLHTNASGDFILAPRKAFDKIHGLCESVDFYLHLDSYAMVQLFSAGYRPAIFGYPHRVYHADHDRSARANARETVSWVEHERRFSEIVRGERSYRLNPPDWGLASEGLLMWWDDLS